MLPALNHSDGQSLKPAWTDFQAVEQDERFSKIRNNTTLNRRNQSNKIS